jgi:hypothetical protein
MLGFTHVKSSELKTWGKYLNDEKKEEFTQVSSNRMVKVIKTEYPDGLDTKAGFYGNATLTSVFDAETGNLLESSITGDYDVGSGGKQFPVKIGN